MFVDGVRTHRLRTDVPVCDPVLLTITILAFVAEGTIQRKTMQVYPLLWT